MSIFFMYVYLVYIIRRVVLIFIIRKLISFQEKFFSIIWKHKYKTKFVDVFFKEVYFCAL